MAHERRARTGVGRTVDAAMLDALVSAQGLHLLPHLAGERATPGATLLGGGAPCYGVFQCQDGGSIALGALEPKFWERFCAQVERPEWLTRAFDPGLREDLRALFATRPRDAWRIILEEAECCASGVLSYDEVPQDPQVIARGLVGPTHVGPPVQFVPPVPEPVTPEEFAAVILGVEAPDRPAVERGVDR